MDVFQLQSGWILDVAGCLRRVEAESYEAPAITDVELPEGIEASSPGGYRPSA